MVVLHKPGYNAIGKRCAIGDDRKCRRGLWKIRGTSECPFARMKIGTTLLDGGYIYRIPLRQRYDMHWVLHTCYTVAAVPTLVEIVSDMWPTRRREREVSSPKLCGRAEFPKFLTMSEIIDAVADPDVPMSGCCPARPLTASS